MKEIWKDIKDYEGLYQVSNMGRVKSLPKKVGFRKGYTQKGKIMSLTPDRDWQLKVAICKNNRPKSIGVHKLVAKAFIPNPDNKPLVSQMDGNKYNNKVENLQWVTMSEARNQAYKRLIESEFKNAKKTNFTTKELMEFYLCWSIGSRGHVGLYRGGPFRSIGRSQAIQIFKSLNCEEIPKDTKEFKQCVLNYMCQLPISDRFRIVNDLLLRSVGSLRITSTRVDCQLQTPLYKQLFESLGIIIKPWNATKPGNKSKGFAILKGSFYINNRWVHVG